MKLPFFQSNACRSREFCRPCRDTGPAGKALREAWAQRFDVPAVDFDCPNGVGWDSAEPAKPDPLDVPAEIIAARLAKCATCDENVDGRCQAAIRKRKACRGTIATAVKVARFACPLDPPRWGEFTLT